MIFCLGAKLLLSLLSLISISIFRDSDPSALLYAFLVSILPIWGEVLASKLTNYEPAREKSIRLLAVDAIVDGLVFVLIPAAWFYFTFKNEASSLMVISLIAFVGCGIFRLRNFLRQGLSNEGYFQGLPVTYTGYQWIVLVLLMKWNLDVLGALIILVISALMVSKKKFIKASR